MFGGFLQREPAKITKFHQLSGQRFVGAKLRDRLVDFQHVVCGNGQLPIDLV